MKQIKLILFGLLACVSLTNASHRTAAIDAETEKNLAEARADSYQRYRRYKNNNNPFHHPLNIVRRRKKPSTTHCEKFVFVEGKIKRKYSHRPSIINSPY